MDATCKIQESIHKYLSFYLICPENWVHINFHSFFNTILLVENKQASIREGLMSVK